MPHCHNCGKEINKQTVDQMVDSIMKLEERSRIQLLAPVISGRRGQHVKLLEQARKNGYVRAIIDGELRELSDDIELEKNKKHNIDIVVDRLIVKDGIQSRLAESIETVLKLSDGLLVVDVDGEKIVYSENFACPECNISVGEIEPRSFSFNSPFGACSECHGLGNKMEFDEDLLIPDKSMSLADGAIVVLGWQSASKTTSFTRAILDALAKEYKFDLNTPFQDYPKKIQDIILYGTNGKAVTVYYKGQRGKGEYNVAFEGLVRNVEKRYRETSAETSKQEYETFMKITPCRECGGRRLRKESLAITVGEKNIAEITEYPIKNLK